MTNLILKMFIGKNIEYSSNKTRNKVGIITNIVGVIANVILFIIKFIIGMLSNSVSIMSDSINNLNDSISSLVALVGFKFSDKKADIEHPFGHGRIEYVSAFVISFIIMWFGLEFFRISIEKILNPVSMTLSPSMFLFLTLTIIIKLWLGFFNYKIGKKINSKAILAASRDSFSDVLVTSVTIISSLVTMYTGYIVDGYAGVFVSLLIFYSGFQIAKETLSILIGETVSPEIIEQIYAITKKYNKIIGVHDLIVHSYGANNYLATIHVEVPLTVSFQDAHNIVDKLEKEVLESLNIHLTTHIDPVDLQCDEIKKIRPVINQFVKSINNEFNMNDLRIIQTNFENKLIFEISVPVSFTAKSYTKIKEDTKKFIETLYPSYECIVSIQKNYSPIMQKGDEFNNE